MAEEQANVAPAEAEAKAPESEANSTNTNEAEAKDSSTLTLTPEQEKIISANGGFEKFFNTAKSAISNPEKKESESKEESKEEKPAEKEQKPEEKVAQEVKEAAEEKLPDGAISFEEMMAKQYFNDLAKEEKYQTIAKDIRSGNILKEMADFGINPTVGKSFNDKKVRMYLDLKAKSVPAEPTNSPAATNIPTVDYVKTGDKITSKAEAEAIISQSAELNKTGQDQHPKIKEAWDFLMGVKPKEESK